MGVFAGPEIAESGLVLALDAGNTKGFDDDENLLTYSEQFNDASWAKNNYNVTANATTAPDGTLTADKLIAINASTFHDLYKSPGLGSNTYTLSIFAKVAEQSFIQLRIDDGAISRLAMFNLSTGSVSSSSNVTSPTITSYPNGWYRCSITVTSAIVNVVFNGYPTSSNATYSGDGVSGVFIWGAQFEYGSSASPYYATTGTAKNRGITLIDMTGRGNSGTLTNGPTYNSANGGSIVFDGVDDYISFNSNPPLTNQMSAEVWVKLNDPQGVNASGLILGRESSYRMLYSSSAIDWICATTNNGWYTTGTAITAGSVTPFSSTLHIVVTYDGVNNKIYINGTLRTTGSSISGDILTNGTYYLMRTTAGNVDYGQGNIYSHKIYNRALSAQEIQQNFIATRSRYSI